MHNEAIGSCKKREQTTPTGFTQEARADSIGITMFDGIQYLLSLRIYVKEGRLTLPQNIVVGLLDAWFVTERQLYDSPCSEWESTINLVY